MRRDTAADNGSVPPVAQKPRRQARQPWTWVGFRQGLSRRHDAEHVLGFARFAVLGPWLVYCVATASSLAKGFVSPATIATAVAIAAAAWLLNAAARDPDIAPRRRVVGIVLDQGFVALSLFLLGERGAWLLPVSMLESVASGVHFGRSYGLLAAALSAAGYGAVLGIRPDAWPQSLLTGRAVAVALFAVPVYVALAAERLFNAGEMYRARARKMARSAMEDKLTGLANRSYLKKSMARAIERARPGEIEEGFAVLHCDLDNFKLINDTHGHAIGDQVLRRAADAIKTCVRATDLVARLGSDEFAVYLAGIGDAEIARRIGRSIVTAVRAVESVDNTPVQLACSLGITMFQAPLGEGVQVEGVLSRAEEAMLQAKRAGKNQFYLQWANL